MLSARFNVVVFSLLNTFISSSFSSAPNDPQYKYQNYLSSDSVIGINAPEAWGYSSDQERSPVIVAIIDSAFDTNNIDLKGKLWTNTAEKPNNNIDDDGNGFVDDYHGYDFRNNDGKPYDGIMNHATPIAGIIAAESNNKFGISGVSGDFPVSIMPLQIVNIGDVFIKSNLLIHGEEIMAAALGAMEYAVDHGANIINMSFNLAKSPETLLIDAGVTAEIMADRYVHAATNFITANQAYSQLSISERFETPIPKSPEREMMFYDLFVKDSEDNKQVIAEMATFMKAAYKNYYRTQKEYERIAKKALDNNVLIVTAGVNTSTEDFDGLPYATPTIDNVLKVGSVDKQGKLSKFSEYGITVPVFALGEKVVSTKPSLSFPWFSTNTGTSFSAGIVTGIAAMAWSLEPDYSYSDIKKALIDGTIKTDALKIELKDGSTYQGGVINALRVLKEL